MAGHSHSANIWGTKSVQDAKRSKLFTRLSKDIVNAVRIGKSTDPNLNPILRAALDKAKAANIPSDRIQKAIDKGSGKSDDKDLTQTKIYEILSPGNTYILVEAETDNPTRTFSEVKLVATRSNFKMMEPGSALRFFSEVGEIILNLREGFEEYPIDNIISTSGIIDFIELEGALKIFVEKESFREYVMAISLWNEVVVESANLIWKNSLKTNAEESENESLQEFESKMLEVQDVVKVWY